MVGVPEQSVCVRAILKQNPSGSEKTRYPPLCIPAEYLCTLPDIPDIFHGIENSGVFLREEVYKAPRFRQWNNHEDNRDGIRETAGAFYPCLTTAKPGQICDKRLGISMFILSGILTGKKGYLAMTIGCQRCGDCCSTMGEIISIQAQIRAYQFRIGYTNGEVRVVSVDPDKRELFRAQQRRRKTPLPAPSSGSGHPMNASTRCTPADPNSAAIISVPVFSFSAGRETKPDGCRSRRPDPSPQITGHFPASGAVPYGMSRFLTMNRGGKT